MGQSSNFLEEEVTGMMNIVEAARAIEWFKAHGLSEEDACDFLTFIATGIDTQKKEPTEEKNSD